MFLPVCVMMRFCLCLISVILAGDPLRHTMSEMERAVPGSVEYFIEWGEEEKKLELYKDLIEGRRRVPVGFAPLRHSELSALIHYHYNPVSLNQIVEIVTIASWRGIIVLNGTIKELSHRIYRFREDFTVVPVYVFNMIAWGESPGQILLAANADGRFDTLEKVELTVRIWTTLCISRLREARHPPPCFIDQSLSSWRINDNVLTELLRWNLLSLIRSRET